MSTLSRRELLRALGLAATSSLLSPRAGAQSAPAPARLKLRPVHVARERIVKTIVGLRPFRPTGFVVRCERIGEKTVVHHYGHGGCGVTLSWGTAELAVNEVARTGEKRIAVLGCGAVGLATARLLRDRGCEATIYARDLPPHTLSDVAGARFYPFDLVDSNAVSPAFLSSVWQAARVAYGVFRKLGPEYGVFLHPSYLFQNSPLGKTSLLNPESPVRDLLRGLRELSAEENPTRAKVTRTFETMMIEPAIYLPAIMRDHAKAGGRIVQREFRSPADLAELKERVIVNSTGFGAAALFGDSEMYPIKGQLTILPPEPEIDYVALPYGLYMFPRKDGIVLGGTFERHVATLEPNREAEARIVAAHARFFAQLGS
jgi:glycine/D-amino acid oxidase-like deaminating enzyme